MPAEISVPVTIGEGTWIRFVHAGDTPSGRTKTWSVEPKGDGAPIGVVRWYSPWRCYALQAEADAVFERKCLREIADFCERETLAVYAAWKLRPRTRRAAR